MGYLQIANGLLDGHPRYQISGSSLNGAFDGVVEYDRDIDQRRYARQAVVTMPPAEVVTDTFHNYYNSTYYQYKPSYYIDLERSEDEFTTITHEKLSSAHLLAVLVPLPFVFSFYGHNITYAHITTGGFLYVGTASHELLTLTQYIAPLMGNFDSSINDSTSVIRYANNGTAFTVEWKHIHVNHLEDAGGFTFQTTLFDDGRIIFAYKKIPVPVSDIRPGSGHTVTVGLSDGFYIDEPLYEGSAVYKRTIYKYHDISMELSKVTDGAAFEFFPLPTCNQLTTCKDCISQGSVIHFDCSWCEAISRCSTGIDRHRDEWVDNYCDLDATYTECPSDSGHSTAVWVTTVTGNSSAGWGGVSAILVVSILLVIFLVMLLIGWVVYAYKFPNSPSGLFLIETQSFMRGKFSRNSSNEDRYIVDPSKEQVPEPEIKVTQGHAANGNNPKVISGMSNTSEA